MGKPAGDDAARAALRDARDPGQRPSQLVDDRQVGGDGRPGHRVEIDGDDPLAQPAQRLGPVAVLERHQADVGSGDPEGVDARPVRRKPRDPGRRSLAEDVVDAGGPEPVADRLGPGRGAMEQIHLDAKAGDGAGESGHVLGR